MTDLESPQPKSPPIILNMNKTNKAYWELLQRLNSIILNNELHNYEEELQEYRHNAQLEQKIAKILDTSKENEVEKRMQKINKSLKKYDYSIDESFIQMKDYNNRNIYNYDNINTDVRKDEFNSTRYLSDKNTLPHIIDLSVSNTRNGNTIKSQIINKNYINSHNDDTKTKKVSIYEDSTYSKRNAYYSLPPFKSFLEIKKKKSFLDKKFKIPSPQGTKSLPENIKIADQILAYDLALEHMKHELKKEKQQNEKLQEIIDNYTTEKKHCNNELELMKEKYSRLKKKYETVSCNYMKSQQDIEKIQNKQEDNETFYNQNRTYHHTILELEEQVNNSKQEQNAAEQDALEALEIVKDVEEKKQELTICLEEALQELEFYRIQTVEKKNHESLFEKKK